MLSSDSSRCFTVAFAASSSQCKDRVAAFSNSQSSSRADQVYSTITKATFLLPVGTGKLDAVHASYPVMRESARFLRAHSGGKGWPSVGDVRYTKAEIAGSDYYLTTKFFVVEDAPMVRSSPPLLLPFLLMLFALVPLNILSSTPAFRLRTCTYLDWKADADKGHCEPSLNKAAQKHFRVFPPRPTPLLGFMCCWSQMERSKQDWAPLFNGHLSLFPRSQDGNNCFVLLLRRRRCR